MHGFIQFQFEWLTWFTRFTFALWFTWLIQIFDLLGLQSRLPLFFMFSWSTKFTWFS